MKPRQAIMLSSLLAFEQSLMSADAPAWSPKHHWTRLEFSHQIVQHYYCTVCSPRVGKIFVYAILKGPDCVGREESVTGVSHARYVLDMYAQQLAAAKMQFAMQSR